MPCHSGLVEDLVVRDGDGFTHAVGGCAGLTFQPLAQHPDGNVGGPATGRLSANAIDDDEDAAGEVDVEAILVDGALAADIAQPGRPQPRGRSSGRSIRDTFRQFDRHLILVLPRRPEERDDHRGQRDLHEQTGPQQARHVSPPFRSR
jgi:hypothetical protein